MICRLLPLPTTIYRHNDPQHLQFHLHQPSQSPLRRYHPDKPPTTTPLSTPPPPPVPTRSTTPPADAPNLPPLPTQPTSPTPPPLPPLPLSSLPPVGKKDETPTSPTPKPADKPTVPPALPQTPQTPPTPPTMLSQEKSTTATPTAPDKPTTPPASPPIPPNLPTQSNTEPEKETPDQILGLDGAQPPTHPEPENMEMSDEFSGEGEGGTSRNNLFIIIGGVVVALLIVVVLVILLVSGGGDDNTSNVSNNPATTDPEQPADPTSVPVDEDENTDTSTSEPTNTPEPTPGQGTTPPGDTDDSQNTTTPLNTGVAPEPLLDPSKLTTQELVVRNYSKQEFQRVLNEARYLNLAPGAMAYLPIRLQEPVQGSTGYIGAYRFFESLDIEVPDTFNQTISPHFTLYAHAPIEQDTQTCRQALGAVTTKCPGVRLGVVLQKQQPADSDPIRPPVSSPELIASWIKTDVSSFKPLILDNTNFPRNPSFKSFTHRVGGTSYAISYLNLPHSSTTLNFTDVAEHDLIIIATSTNSLYAALDALD